MAATGGESLRTWPRSRRLLLSGLGLAYPTYGDELADPERRTGVGSAGEAVADGAEPREVVHVRRQRGYAGDGDAGVG